MNRKADEYENLGIEPEKAEVSGGGVSLRSLRTFDSLKNPVFRLYYVSLVGQWASMNMQMVTRSLLIYRLTGSGTILGVMALASAVPMILLSLFGGAIADRVQKKYVLLVGQLCSAVIALGVAISLTMGYLSPAYPGSWWILIASAVLQGTVMGIMMPSRQAMIPEIVSEDQVMNAISLNNMGMNLFRVLAPTLAGFLIDALDFHAVYYTVTFLYLVATVCVVFLPRTSVISPRGSSALADISEGISYVRHQKVILLILLFTLSGMICGHPFMFLLPMFTEDILRVGATEMGLLIGISGLGAITASLILASLPNRRRGLMMMLSGLVLGLALVGFSLSHWWHLSMIIVIFVGMGQTGHMTTGNTLAMYYSEPKYRGRVMSFHMMGMGFASLGTFLAGMLAEAAGVQWSVGGLAVVFILIIFMLVTLAPRLRNLE
jgi:MFS family permease